MHSASLVHGVEQMQRSRTPPAGQQSHESPPEQVPPVVGSQNVVASTSPESIDELVSIEVPESVAVPASPEEPESFDEPESDPASSQITKTSMQPHGPLQYASIATAPTSIPPSPAVVASPAVAALLHPSTSSKGVARKDRSIIDR